MSDLSDFKQLVYEPEVARLKAQIALLRHELTEARNQLERIRAAFDDDAPYEAWVASVGGKSGGITVTGGEHIVICNAQLRRDGEDA